MRTLVSTLLTLVLAFPFVAGAVRANENADALSRGWEWWKSISELAREQLAPKLIEIVGKSGGSARLGVAGFDNLTRYRALCGRGGGTFRGTALCQAMQFKLGERSAMSLVLLALHRRAGTQTSPARDAAAILAGLRLALGLDKKKLSALPQHILAGLYEELGHCASPVCKPGLMEGSALNSWLKAGANYVAAQGSDREVEAARKLQDFGWK